MYIKAHVTINFAANTVGMLAKIDCVSNNRDVMCIYHAGITAVGYVEYNTVAYY